MDDKKIEKILDPDYEICLCRHIRTQEIIEIIKGNHFATLKELCEAAQVGDKCGGCREELSAILSFYNSSSSCAPENPR